MIGLTDTSAANKYQVAQAALLNPAGSYVTPKTSALTAAAAAMTKDPGQSQVLRFNPTSAAAKKAPAAYPLAMPIYAAVNPAMSDAAARADYASFIGYAATAGQTTGTNDGQLPDGYAPLPAAWKKQALAAASVIKKGKWSATAPVAPTPSASSSTKASSGSTPTGGGSASGDPTASGTKSGSLSGAKTPDDPAVGALTAVVPATAAVGLLTAFGVPLISRLRRRQL